MQRKDISMKKIYVLLNPNARSFRLRRALIEKYENFDYEGLKIFKSSDIDGLRVNVKKISRDKPDYICIGGGDGTIHVVLNELMKVYKTSSLPPILILQEGTMNNIARTIHLEGHGYEILGRLISAVKNKSNIPVFRRDTFQIDNRFGFIFGLGLVTNFLKLAYSGTEKGTLRNLYVAAKTAVEALVNTTDGEIFANMDLVIEADGRDILINPVTGILSGTVEHIGMGFSPLIEAAAFPGKFQTLILGMKPRRVLFNILKLKRGDKLSEAGYANFHSTSMMIKSNTKFEYTIDGDIYISDGTLCVESGPAITLVKV
jgi:diacylglycerol kinase family enzyme